MVTGQFDHFNEHKSFFFTIFVYVQTSIIPANENYYFDVLIHNIWFQTQNIHMKSGIFNANDFLAVKKIAQC